MATTQRELKIIWIQKTFSSIQHSRKYIFPFILTNETNNFLVHQFISGVVSNCLRLLLTTCDNRTTCLITFLSDTIVSIAQTKKKETCIESTQWDMKIGQLMEKGWFPLELVRNINIDKKRKCINRSVRLWLLGW